MRDALINKANEIISILKEIPVVKGGSTEVYQQIHMMNYRI